MNKKFLTAISFSAFLLIAPNVKAANFTDNQTVDTNKTWTIKFTDDVEFDDATKQGITIADSKGAITTVGIQLGQDSKTVIVTAAQGGYTPGENYILNVGSKVHSSKGKTLKNECKVHFNIKSNNGAITFKDTNFEKMVRNKIGKTTGDIYKSDVEKITSLDVHDENISDISGIENFTSLQTVYLTNTQISDISALKGLTNLQYLNLHDNPISDIGALKGLTNLKSLSLANSKVSDISALKGLPNLQSLSLHDNPVSDISVLKGLTNLQGLSLVNSGISDISALPNLQYLYLDDNKISDISTLSRLTNLEELSLRSNQISDISALKGLPNLKTLSLDDNKISDISILKGFL